MARAPWDMVRVIALSTNVKAGDQVSADSYFSGVNWSEASTYDGTGNTFTSLLPGTGANLKVGQGYYVSFVNDSVIVP